jgi:isoamylase
VFRRRRFFAGKPIRTGDQFRDIAWLTPAGSEMTPENWGSGLDQCVAVFLNGEAITAPNERGERVADDSFLLCFNAHSNTVDFVAPDIGYAAQWTAAIDTADPTGDTDLVVAAGEKLSLAPRSLLVLRKTA